MSETERERERMSETYIDSDKEKECVCVTFAPSANPILTGKSKVQINNHEMVIANLERAETP